LTGQISSVFGITLDSSFRNLSKEEDAPMLTSTLISVIVTLIVIGLLLYLIGLIPMDGTIKQIIRVVVIIAVVIWLLQTFGLLGSLGLHHVVR
jgi:putative exporter of polyketide antibiotics